MPRGLLDEKSLLTYQFFSFGISPRILAYQPGFWHIKYVWSTFGVSARILAYQSMFLYHLPLLTGWELQYRIQGCFHPVHVHSPVFLEQFLPVHLIHDPSRQPVSVFPHALLAS